MKRSLLHSGVPFLGLLAAIATVLALMLALGPVNSAQAGQAPEPPAQQPDNSACLGCHSQPGGAWTLPNGDQLGTSVDPQTYGKSVHANLDCKTCHTNITSYPHPANSAQTARDFTLQYKDTCKQCHPNEMATLADSVHTQILQNGNQNAPICSDCHNPHSQQVINLDKNGQPSSQEHATIAKICSKCHNAIYQEYLTSVHGSGITDNKNPDVPSCVDCHGVHNVQGPDSPGFRLNSPTLVCGKCHTNASIMSKYGISTDVMNTYVADFHGTTVTIFQKTDPNAQTNKPVCFDCHGVHDIKRVDDPQYGLSIKQNMLAACQRCHPDANANFPASWLSHYIPSADKTPLVYWVNVFYIILIPSVLGVMVLFIATDIYRRLVVNRRKAVAHAEPVEKK